MSVGCGREWGVGVVWRKIENGEERGGRGTRKRIKMLKRRGNFVLRRTRCEETQKVEKLNS